MRHRYHRIPVSFSRSLYFYAALLLLMIPVRLLFALVFSAAVHEVFHIAAVRLMGLQVYSIHIGARGAVIQTQPMNHKQELLCALSGPVGGLFLLALFRWMPVIALTGAVQSLYNLLPLYPTDGGRALRCGAQLLWPGRTSGKIIYIIEIITLSVIIAFCVFGSVWLRLGIVPILFGTSMLFGSVRRK